MRHGCFLFRLVVKPVRLSVPLRSFQIMGSNDGSSVQTMNATLLHLLLTIPPIFAPKKLNLGNLFVSLSASTTWYPATVAWALSNLCHGTQRSCLALLCVRWAVFQQSLGVEGLALQLRVNAGKHRLSNTHDKMGYNMMWAVPSKANIILRTETVFPKQVEKLAMARTSSASSSFNPIGKNQCLTQVFSTRKVQKNPKTLSTQWPLWKAGQKKQ